ncbi:hypothetical protein BT96DRAFT_504989 [Gymnopus androsaceus JB14]|uniref:DUF6699 domain-containing protein n=1 Tax=Gymnopus androsaceus JB14 TaxID=1447944 RepID=A0A6A4HV46_9AGAR|nr:hypothetical protein BT96DRAFT_504989 [Gymnopus androsaceus JB14]
MESGTDGVRNEGNNIYYEVSDEEEDKFSIVDLSLEDAVPSVAAGQAGKMAKEMTASNIQPPSVPTPWGPYNAPPMTTPYNLPPTTNPYNVPPTMNPYNVPPTTNPYNVPPTTNPYNVPPTTNPYNVPTPKAGPYNVPTPRAGPYNVPTPRGPYNLPTPRGPNDGPTSVNPLGMSWGVPNLTGPYGGPSIGPWGVPPWTVPTSMDPYGGPTSIGPYGQTSMGTVLKPNEMAHVDKFAAGTHYGPVLEPFLTHVLWVVPKLNPLIMSVHFEAGEPQHEYLRWNMLWAPDTVHRSSDPPQTSWLVGRYSPATFPRIASMRLLSSILHPFTIEIFAQDPDIGVTCEDLIDGIFRFMRKHSSKADFHNLSTSRKRIVLKSYKYNRSLVRRQLGEALGEGLQRMDFLGEETMFGGIREDPIAVMRLCGQVLPCTWILDCMTEYAAEEH